MSSGGHLSKELHDIIKSIGETRSKQEEDKIILKEVALLRTKLQEKSIPPKKMKEHLLRAIYIEMLGHDASFAHIHAVNLTQSKILSLKKLGYLCCSLFLDSNSELLILLVATLQRDLGSTSIHEIQIALTAVCKLISPSFVGALVEPVLKLLNHQTDIIRKKAIMVLQKIKQMLPSAISDNDYDERMRRAFQDKEACVMGAALNLYYDEIKKGNLIKYKGMATNFVATLKQIIEHKLHKDFDYHRFPAPWLQIKLLQILALLGSNDLKISEQIYEILSSTLRRADDTTINIGYAVTYQCVKTIATLYPNQSLLEQAANSISRFLKSENNNLKYLGINALIQIVQINSKYVIEHQMTIVDCLESPDDTLKMETLELLYRMTNDANYEVIINKLIHFLKTSSDATFKKDLFNKTSLLNEKHAPTQEWFIRTANTIFEYGSEFIDNDVLNNFFKLIYDNYTDMGNDFGEFIIDIYLEILQRTNLQDNIIKMICWVIGEIGSQTYEDNSQKLNEMTQAIASTLNTVFENELTISWVLTALAKLQSAKGFQMYDQTRAIFEKYSFSKHIDCQQRSKDFLLLAKVFNAALKKSNQVIVDSQLSFLNAYVQAEKLKGAASYNSTLSMKAAGLGGVNESTQLHFEPYKDEKYLAKPKNAGLGTSKEEQTGIKARGPEKWTKDGYKEEQSVQTLPKPTVTNTTAISSSNMSSNQTTVKSNTPAPGNTTTNQNSMSSLSSSQFQNQPASQAPPKITEKKEDPQLKEKQNLANSLFAGLSTQTQSKQQASTMQPKKQVVQQTPQQLGGQKQTTVQPQTANLNLLDFDDTGSQQQQKPTQMVQQQQQIQMKPLMINVEAYEKYWDEITNLRQEDLMTKIRSENDFRKMIQTININIIEVIDKEIICAGQNVMTQNVLLLYGQYDISGKLSLQMKSKDNKDFEFIISSIKKNFI